MREPGSGSPAELQSGDPSCPRARAGRVQERPCRKGARLPAAPRPRGVRCGLGGARVQEKAPQAVTGLGRQRGGDTGRTRGAAAHRARPAGTHPVQDLTARAGSGGTCSGLLRAPVGPATALPGSRSPELPRTAVCRVRFLPRRHAGWKINQMTLQCREGKEAAPRFLPLPHPPDQPVSRVSCSRWSGPPPFPREMSTWSSRRLGCETSKQGVGL